MKFENKGKWLSQIQESRQMNEDSFNYNIAKKELANELKKSDEDEWYTKDANKHYVALLTFAEYGDAFYQWVKSKLESGESAIFYQDFIRKSGMDDEMKKANLTSKQKNNILHQLELRTRLYQNRYKYDGKI